MRRSGYGTKVWLLISSLVETLPPSLAKGHPLRTFFGNAIPSLIVKGSPLPTFMGRAGLIMVACIWLADHEMWNEHDVTKLGVAYSTAASIGFIEEEFFFRVILAGAQLDSLQRMVCDKCMQWSPRTSRESMWQATCILLRFSLMSSISSSGTQLSFLSGHPLHSEAEHRWDSKIYSRVAWPSACGSRRASWFLRRAMVLPHRWCLLKFPVWNRFPCRAAHTCANTGAHRKGLQITQINPSATAISDSITCRLLPTRIKGGRDRRCRLGPSPFNVIFKLRE